MIVETEFLVVKAFFDPDTCTLSYVVRAKNSMQCVIIDPVTDFDMSSGRVSYQSAEQLVEYIQQNQLELTWILETHAHADHLSGAPYLLRKLGGKIGIGEHISEVQKIFRRTFNLGEEFKTDGSQFSYLFRDNEEFEAGDLKIKVIYVPGHTPADIAYIIHDSIFVGDTLFEPDGGSARSDFPGGDAKTLFQSAKRIMSYPEHYRIFVCHDYQPNGRELAFVSTIAEHKKKNIHFSEQVDADSFIEMRTERDKTLNTPKLLIPSIQTNIQAGEFPEPEDNGVAYIKIPINQI